MQETLNLTLTLLNCPFTIAVDVDAPPPLADIRREAQSDWWRERRSALEHQGLQNPPESSLWSPHKRSENEKSVRWRILFLLLFV